jgi:hypothetical protein
LLHPFLMTGFSASTQEHSNDRTTDQIRESKVGLEFTPAKITSSVIGLTSSEFGRNA